MKNSQIKALAKARMKANQTTSIILIIFNLLIFSLSHGEYFFINIISLILTPVIAYAVANISIRNKENISLSDAFKNFNFNYWLKVFVANLIINIPTIIFNIASTSILLGLGMSYALPSFKIISDSTMILIVGGTIFVIIILALLQIIFGILIQLLFGLCNFVAFDYQELGIIEMLKKSFNLMKGHKKELFFLELSFILWFLGIGILNYILLFIPFISIFSTIITGLLISYVIIYLNFSIGEFYKHLIGQDDIFNNETIEIEII